MPHKASKNEKFSLSAGSKAKLELYRQEYERRRAAAMEGRKGRLVCIWGPREKGIAAPADRAKVAKPKSGTKAKPKGTASKRVVQHSTRTLRSTKGKKLVGGLPDGIRI